VIAEEFERLGIKPDEISLKVGIFGAEPWGRACAARSSASSASTPSTSTA
jgi:phenylacetate-coenzyme A ligase PaaK-like adenylate-forming protein